MKIKDFIGYAVLALVGVVLFGPTLVGVLDLTWYFYTGHILTSVEWTEGRVWFAVGMPILASMLGAMATI